MFIWFEIPMQSLRLKALQARGQSFELSLATIKLNS